MYNKGTLGSPCASVDTFLLNYWFQGNLVNGGLLSFDILPLSMCGCAAHKKNSWGTIEIQTVFTGVLLTIRSNIFINITITITTITIAMMRNGSEGLPFLPPMTRGSVTWVSGWVSKGKGWVLGLRGWGGVRVAGGEMLVDSEAWVGQTGL